MDELFTWKALGQLVLAVIVGSGFVTLALRTWLTEKIKGSIKRDYDKELETHKNDLKRAGDNELEKQKAELKRHSDIEIEQLKSRLSLAAAQQQMKFSHLYEKRAEVIAKVYAALQNFVQAVTVYTAIFEPVGMPSKDLRLRDAVAAANKFVLLFSENRIFVPHATADKLHDLSEQYRQAMIDFQYGVDLARQLGGDIRSTERSMEIFKKIKNLSEVGLVDLENDFRRLLGDEGQDKS